MPFQKGRSFYRLKKITWEVNENGCWICTSHAPDGGGYPRHKVNYKGKRISHTMYEVHKGKIPNGLIVCHKCDNKMCINPDHLFVGTQADNMRDMCEKCRKFITNGEMNGQSKLTEEQVIEIRSIRKTQGLSQQKIADMFNVSRANIGLIVTGERWKYLSQNGAKT